MKIFESYLLRSLACLVIALPIAILFSLIEPVLAPALGGGVTFIGCWKILTPRVASSKEM